MPSTETSPTSIRDRLIDAIRYWELRRIGYNLLLTLIVVGWVVVTWPHFRAAITPVGIRQIFMLAILANIFYCAAYFVDIPLQFSAFRNLWRRHRWWLWVVGTLLAASLAHFWMGDEVYFMSLNQR